MEKMAMDDRSTPFAVVTYPFKSARANCVRVPFLHSAGNCHPTFFGRHFTPNTVPTDARQPRRSQMPHGRPIR